MTSDLDSSSSQRLWKAQLTHDLCKSHYKKASQWHACVFVHFNAVLITLVKTHTQILLIHTSISHSVILLHSGQYLSSTGFVELDPEAMSDSLPKLSRVLLITGTAGHKCTRAQSWHHLKTREEKTASYVSMDKAAISRTNSQGGVKEEVEKTVCGNVKSD